ncbi:unnamed protein product [Amoebophrya sp. A120]|nr:unnamed protein product [Amoebophrya sp. A120]|eukprot:GSA120T00011971001.1
MFCLSSLVDRRCNPLLKPLAQYIHLPACHRGGLSDKVKQCLHNITLVLASSIRKRAQFENPADDNIMLYTDASFSHGSGWLSAVLVWAGQLLVRLLHVRESDGGGVRGTGGGGGGGKTKTRITGRSE